MKEYVYTDSKVFGDETRDNGKKWANTKLDK